MSRDSGALRNGSLNTVAPYETDPYNTLAPSNTVAERGLEGAAALQEPGLARGEGRQHRLQRLHHGAGVPRRQLQRGLLFVVQ